MNINREKIQKKWILLFVGILLISSCSNDEPIIPAKPEPPRLNVKDSLALVDIYQKANGQYWESVNWDLEDIQTWGGVTIALDESYNEYRVVMFLMPTGSRGILSDKIGDLDQLIQLNISGQGLIGELPKTIGNLKNLQFLFVRSTSLTGALPKEIGNLQNIEIMHILYNEFTELPKEFGNLPNTGVYILHNNKFGGEVPETINILHVSDPYAPRGFLDLSYNQFTSLPWSFFLSDSSRFVPVMTNNRLSGTIPEEVLASPKWEKWNYRVDNQEPGYGYANYPTSDAKDKENE